SELTQILQNQQTPSSPEFQHWLTHSQEASMFGPNPVVMQNALTYFQSEGFTLQTRGIASLSFSGTVGQAQSAFRTDLVNVHFPNGSFGSLDAQPLSLPGALAPYVQTVNGVAETSVNQYEMIQLPTDIAPVVGGGPSSQTGYAQTNLSDLYNFTNHAFGWTSYYTEGPKGEQVKVNSQLITPGGISYAYDALPLLNAGYNGDSTGTPITIAIVMGLGLNPGDFSEYAQQVWNNPNQILDRLTALPVDGAYGLNGTKYYTDGTSGEMALDIEYSSTMAPAAHIDAVYGQGGLDTKTLDDDYAKLWSLAKAPNIISNSWGGGEDYNNLYGPNWENFQTMNNYIMLLTAMGSTVLASSGDGGGFDLGDGVLTASYPAADPYVVSVDGARTVLAGPDGLPYTPVPSLGAVNVSLSGPNGPNNFVMRVGTATQVINESYWYSPYSNYSLLRAAPFAAGGFGTSSWFNQSWWEHGQTMPNVGRELGSTVAAEGDFNESIYFDGAWEFNYGGTSFACPTAAGELALVEDYLAAHGHSSYLGNGNIVTATIGNAWWNGNLTLDPYIDITNGTSYWANQGEVNGWSWTPGQVFPYNGTTPTYGDTHRGWNFPDGWGIINAYNFAVDLNAMESMPGSFASMNSAGSTYDPSVWGNLATNGSYTLHVNSTSAIDLLSPRVTVLFWNASGVETASVPTLTSDGTGYTFSLDTTGFNSAGYVVFEFGDSTNSTLGFAYSWIAPFIPKDETLSVTVVDPASGVIPGGTPVFNAALGQDPFVYGYPDDPLPAGIFQDTVTVLVTYNGVPVYDVPVTATIPSYQDIAWQGSESSNLTGWGQTAGAATVTNEMSSSLTNVSGEALIYTTNVNRPTTYTLTASYAGQVAHTTFQDVPPPNIAPIDNDGGNWSEFDWIDFQSWEYRDEFTANQLAYNAENQSDYYSEIYAWQGEDLTVKVTNSTGANVPDGTKVWLGTLDTGRQTEFNLYSASGGILGITNTSGTNSSTGANGDPAGEATVYVPDNITPTVDGVTQVGPYPETAVEYPLEFLSVDLAGQQNRTSSRNEPCFPYPFPFQAPVALTNCVYNNSYQRNYSSAALAVLPDPVTAYTQTQAGSPQDFFRTGSNISWEVNVTLPDLDPFAGQFWIGWEWPAGLEHIVNETGYVDCPNNDYANCAPAGYLTVDANDNQAYDEFGNLTGVYTPGIHTLEVVVRDSMGHVFTARHVFIIGQIALTDLPASQVYTPIPFNLTWTLNIPSTQVSNKTFNESLEISYVTNVFVDGSLQGCGGFGRLRCPQVVNLSIPVRPGETNYTQNVNRSTLEHNGFYSGGTDIPPGQYQILVWLNANHSGSISQEAVTYLVFDPLAAEITGPSANAVVPLGNVTLSYSYTGQYISNAQLFVYAQSNPTSAVFESSIYSPGTGIRGGGVSWTAVTPGAYRVALGLSTPYGNSSISEWINVSMTSPYVWLNLTPVGALGGLSPPTAAASLAIVGALVGLTLGYFVVNPSRQKVPSDRKLPTPSDQPVPSKSPGTPTPTSTPSSG
ncbi:MAG: S8 family serine peptidase, partial [Thermoplasmata archaeon]|nr:S8 family serine peptidase [Thermoplasmata archaeon]